jgi:hypothetical protein
VSHVVVYATHPVQHVGLLLDANYECVNADVWEWGK